ncbi:MAG: DUF3800 domain-containing protein [Synergistaceae bacterium]|jgi:hypothetical protein|nr:DUF3800 domain-containing protein [Synergistaceae bacterium]
MYLLYLDDSGSPQNVNENHFILGGFIIPETSLYWVNKNLDNLAEELPTNSADIVEFHASEIAGGRKSPWEQFKNKQERLDILKKVLQVATDSRNGIKILACAVEKNQFPGADPVELAFEDLCSRFHQFLQRKHVSNNEKANGLIILDESSYKTTLQRLAKNFRTLGTKWGHVLTNIQEVPMFVDSKASRGIQLADHIAYSIFRRYEHADLTYYNIIEGYFDSVDGRLHGLCHSTLKQSCTCPYCMQKKLLALAKP